MDGKPSPGNRSGRKKNLSIIIIIIISYKKNCIKTFEQVLKKLKNIQCSWMSLSSKQNTVRMFYKYKKNNSSLKRQVRKKKSLALMDSE